MNEKNLQKLQRLFQAMDEDSLTRAEFQQEFKKLLEFLKALKEKNRAEFTSLNSSIAELREKVKQENNDNISGLKDETLRQITKALKEQENGMNFIRDTLRKIKNGKDGRDGIDGKDGSPDTPKEIRDKIKTLKGNKRLPISAIKDLKKKLIEIGKQKIIQTVGGGGGGGHTMKVYDLSDSLNGVLKTFSLPAFWRVISVHSSSFPNAFRPTTDYTTDANAMTITFTSEIDAGTTLATGQTIIVTYSE